MKPDNAWGFCITAAAGYTRQIYICLFSMDYIFTRQLAGLGVLWQFNELPAIQVKNLSLWGVNYNGGSL